MPKKSKNADLATNGAILGYEAEIWRMADALRGGMGAAEYTHVILNERRPGERGILAALPTGRPAAMGGAA